MTGQARLDLNAGAQAILERPLSTAEAAGFEKYLKLLQKWGSVYRLIGSTEPDWIVENLFLDSLLFLRLLSEPVETLMDLGSGPGVPGIPIKIVRPEIRVTLLESVRRKASFLSTVVRELALTGARVINVRAEAAPAELLGTFDAVVMRCAGTPHRLVPLALRFVRPGGIVIRSAPPAPYETSGGGERRLVPGVRPGKSRAFEVHRRPL